MKILTSAAPKSPALEELLQNPNARERVLTFLTANSAHSTGTQELHVVVGGKRFSVCTSATTSSNEVEVPE